MNLKICLEEYREPKGLMFSPRFQYTPLPDSVQILLEKDVLEFLWSNSDCEECPRFVKCKFKKHYVDEKYGEDHGIYPGARCPIDKAIQKLLKEIEKK